ncbi:MAG TPA: WD40 repeat domain-containing protein [Verrucomicrobiae bacterium]
MKTILTILVYAICLFENFQSAFAQGFNDSAYDLIQQDRFGTQFQNGDTNAPLLAIDWFNGPRIDYFCQVSRSGNVSSARNVINWAIQGGHWAQLDRTNLDLLIATINALPPPPKVSPPQERWLVVRGIRKNQWFKNIYDRADFPKEVETLFQITGAYLEWFMPRPEGHQISTSLDASEFYVARNAPKVVLFASTNVIVFDLDMNKILETIPRSEVYVFPMQEWGMQSRTLSPDGNILVDSIYQNGQGVYAFDLKARKILWTKEGFQMNHIVVGGDKGQFLFIANRHSIERWDLASGKSHAVLATNLPMINWTIISQDGKIFAAGYGSADYAATNSATVWRADEDKPAAQLDDIGHSSGSLSPDGRILALTAGGGIALRDWQKGLSEKIPIHFPYGLFEVRGVSWSPDGKYVALSLNGSQPLMGIYETTTWKPMAILPPDQSEFIQNGDLIQFRSGEMYNLDASSLTGLGK